jgi:integrase
MRKLSVVSPSAATPLARLVDDYLAAARAAGASPKTIRFGYGFPLREVFLPWAVERGLQAPAQLDNRVLDDFTIHLREHGGKRGPLSEHSIWTYAKAVNRFVRWLREEGEEVQTDGRKLPKLPKKLVTVLSRSDIAHLEAVATAERDKLIVRVLADGGLRVGELVKLRPRDFEEQSGTHFLRISGKGARERLVPLDRSLLRRLRRYADHRPGDSDRLFLSLDLDAPARDEPAPRGPGLGHSALDMITNVYSHLTPTDAHRELMAALRAERDEE